MWTVPAPPALDPAAPDAKEIGAAEKAAQRAAGGPAPDAKGDA